MRTVDITSRLGQFAWRRITPSTVLLPVIFRNNNREEYLCVQMINIHFLSKFSSESISYCMKQSPLHYFPLTQSEAKLFQYIHQFHSNGCLANLNQLDYSRSDLVYITPFIPFIQFYQLILSHSQFIPNNTFWLLNKQKEDIKNKSLSNKIISSSPINVCKSNNSYYRSIVFREKQIMSYSTTSSIDSNQTILCLSIKDIVSTYFPWTTSEQFIQLCRLKQIIRYKPDKSTNSDLSLRLINIQQLEQYWHFFSQQLTSSPQLQLKQQTNENSSMNNSSSLTIDTNDNSSNLIEQSFEDTSKNVPSPVLSEHRNAPCQLNSIQSIDDEHIQLEISSLLNQLIEIIEQQNELTTKTSDNQQEEINENKTVKRKRRRLQQCIFTSKRRKRKQSNDKIQWWLNKYSIEPISILLHRVNLPIH